MRLVVFEGAAKYMVEEQKEGSTLIFDEMLFGLA